MHHQIINTITNDILFTGEPNKSLFVYFCKRSQAAGGEALYGDHFRIMKRRRDAHNIVLKCKKTNEIMINLEL